MSERKKIGIIGTGNISNQHLKGYDANESAQLYALCDLNRELALSKAQKYGVPEERVFTDYNEMLKLPEIDAVSVCTWNSAHTPCTIAALNAGKHVLCEKPMATSAKDARDMKAAAEKNNKLLMIGFVRRFGNDCAILKDYVNDGFFGDIYYAKATYLRRNGNPGGWFGDKSRSGGGPLIDLGVHVTDLVRYLMGNPKPVSVYGVTYQKLFNRPGVKGKPGYTSVSKSDNDICDVEDFTSALIRFDNGAVLSLEAAFSLNIKSDRGNIELFGTKAGAQISPDIEIYTNLNNYMANVNLAMPTALSFENLFANEIDHFVSCLTGEAECISPAADGVDIMVILDAIYESARTGHEVLIHA